MRFIVDQQVEDIEMPENLKLNTFLQEFHSDCTHTECRFGFYGFAFGQSPFPVPRLIQEALIKNAHRGQYAAVPGVPELRNAISKYNKHYFGMDVSPERIYVGPGTKELIFNLLEILHGTVILPTPAWLGYLPQIRFLKKNYHMLPSRANGKIAKPKYVFQLSDLPKTRTGKIMRRLLKSKLLGKDLGDISSLENPNVLDEITKLDSIS